VVLLGVAGLVLPRLGVVAPDAAFLRLAVAGALWFLAAFAPAYLLYVSGRHAYIPSLGLCLLLAVAVWFPAWCAREAKRRLVLEGMALGVLVLLGHGFYTATLGEAATWGQAGRWIERLRDQIRAACPTLPHESRVVVLAETPARFRNIPLLPNYALQAGLRHWYRNPELRAEKGFIPRRRDFTLDYSPAPDHYERLLVFIYRDETLERMDYLRFEDGEQVRLGAAIDPERRPVPEAVLRVESGRPVR
jgi:hypothetical protein